MEKKDQNQNQNQDQDPMKKPEMDPTRKGNEKFGQDQDLEKDRHVIGGEKAPKSSPGSSDLDKGDERQ